MGYVSYVVNSVMLVVATDPKDTPWHSLSVVACSGMSIGHKGMIYAAKTLAMTMVDLFEDEKLRDDIKSEFLERKGDYVYKGNFPYAPPPIYYKDYSIDNLRLTIYNVWCKRELHKVSMKLTVRTTYSFFRH